MATGADGAFDLYEDAGEGATKHGGRARQGGGEQCLHGRPLHAAGDRRHARHRPGDGSFAGQVQDRSWTATFRDADRPRTVTVDGRPVAATAWTYDAATRTISVPVDERSVTEHTVVRFSSEAARPPTLRVADPQVAAGAVQTVTGAGFPADTDVALATTPDLGGATAHTDAAARFSAELDGADHRVGPGTVTASVGPRCSPGRRSR